MAICKNCNHQLIYYDGRFKHLDTDECYQEDFDPERKLVNKGVNGCWCGCEKPELKTVAR